MKHRNYLVIDRCRLLLGVLFYLFFFFPPFWGKMGQEWPLYFFFSWWARGLRGGGIKKRRWVFESWFLFGRHEEKKKKEKNNDNFFTFCEGVWKKKRRQLEGKCSLETKREKKKNSWRWSLWVNLTFFVFFAVNLRHPFFFFFSFFPWQGRGYAVKQNFPVIPSGQSGLENVCLFMCMCVWERERECVCVCVCVMKTHQNSPMKKTKKR